MQNAGIPPFNEILNRNLDGKFNRSSSRHMDNKALKFTNNPTI
jgi:hypothetical protein